MTGKIYRELYFPAIWTISNCMKFFPLCCLISKEWTKPQENFFPYPVEVIYGKHYNVITVVMQCFILYPISFQKSKYAPWLLIKDSNVLDRVQCLDFCLYLKGLKKRLTFRPSELTPRLKPDYSVYWGLIFFFCRVERIMPDIKVLQTTKNKKFPAGWSVA